MDHCDIRKFYTEAGPGSSDGTAKTQEIREWIAKKWAVETMDESFETNDDAHYTLDVAWES